MPPLCWARVSPDPGQTRLLRRKAGEALLKDYLHQREGDFTGYAPERADMVGCGVVCRNETWLGRFICPDPEGARTAFEAACQDEIDAILKQDEFVSRTADISVFRSTFGPATEFCFDQAKDSLYFDGNTEEDTLLVGVL